MLERNLRILPWAVLGMAFVSSGVNCSSSGRGSSSVCRTAASPRFGCWYFTWEPLQPILQIKRSKISVGISDFLTDVSLFIGDPPNCCLFFGHEGFHLLCVFLQVRLAQFKASDLILLLLDYRLPMLIIVDVMPTDAQ